MTKIVDALGAPHAGERSEEELIASFVDRIAELSPQLGQVMIDRVVMKITSLNGEAGRRTGRLPIGGGSTHMNFRPG